ncbi:E3 SUMO-protein ligase RanBP2-like isoform X2 [Physella acuta]|uniref:E3 SUMO-protein ligase RanBP2-like isoform X2 n=1 Tax=Physella acuta TaxID=109671 RepID=UPI0027DD24B2|nr:E3 SUMO-protein ligase RanBP2-like isoform X2 [Physella acuta]
MFKRKQDVDKHVASVLARKRDEKERNAAGFQVARLYSEIKEYDIAKKYLAGFLKVRETAPQAHQLMGEINEALGLKELAIDDYKRALDLGGFGSANRQLVKKICELYCDIGNDEQRMKYWLDKCEGLFPKSEIVYKLKAKIAEANGHSEDNSKEMENLVISELNERPADVTLRIKLLNIYLDSGRFEEAYEAAVGTDLTTAFVDRLQWFETLDSVFQEFGKKNKDTETDTTYNLHLLHILRNVTYLSLGAKEIAECSIALYRFDKQLKRALSIPNQDELWTAMLREMKGQMFFLAGLLLLKRAQSGAVQWQEVNQLAGACFLASRSMDPLDAQSPWFVTAPHDRSKFNSWWHLQSYDRLSQVGHMLLQLSQNDLVDWSRSVKQQTMTTVGHQRVFKTLYAPRDLKVHGEASFFYEAKEMVDGSDPKEPLTMRHMLDIDRVAFQVHLGDLSHLVWICLQRYSPDMPAQPNYHFSIMENIQFSVKNLESAGGESLCQLDLLVFLLATVRCSASSITENIFSYEDRSGRPTLLPVCLGKPLCTPEQEEWWKAAYKFCSNTVKDDFSRLRRILIRGIETVRLIGQHGMSVSLTTHIARSLDAKIKSLKESEFGCRCPVSELTALENRAAFYWERSLQALERIKRNQHIPAPKNRMFREVSDLDLPPRLIDKYSAEVKFALSLIAMKRGDFEAALEGFESHRSPWAKYHSSQIYKLLAEKEADKDDYMDGESSSKKQALLQKSRDCLHEVMDHLSGDTAHELNYLVTRDLDEIEMQIHGFQFEEKDSSTSSSFHTPSKFPNDVRASSSINGGIAHSTPRFPTVQTSRSDIGIHTSQSTTDTKKENIRDNNMSSTSENYDRPRPSPERLDSQIKSLSYSQTSLFKMVLDRNEELIMINGKMMEELRDNNNQLKSVLVENKTLMDELKNFLAENRDMMKHIKNELSVLKASHVASPAATIPPAPPLFMPPMPASGPPRGPYTGYPPPAYSGYMINSPVPPQPPLGPGPQYRPTGLPGSRSSNVGKYRPQSEEDEEEEDDISNIEREYFEHEQSYTQFYTPEAQMLQEWSVSSRSGIDNQPPMSLPPMQPRMNMPAPGYFASALRGQSLQYAQNAQTPGQVKPTPGPGFFSTPLPSVVPAPAPVIAAPVTPIAVSNVKGPVPDTTSSPALLSALSGQRSITAGTSKIDSSVTSPQPNVVPPSLSGESRIKSLFHARAVMEPKKAKGEITILVDTHNNRATILMMSDTREILYHHDIRELKIEPSFVATNVIWTGTKVGSQDREKVTVTLDSSSVATQLKDAIQKAAALIQPKVTTPQDTRTAPSIFGGFATPSSSLVTTTTTVAATSTTSITSLTGSTTKTSPKPTFGGFTFASNPLVTPTAEKPKVDASKNTPVTKEDAPKPFAGFSLTPSSTAAKPELKFSASDKSLFSKSPGAVPKSPGAKSPGAGDDDHVEEYEPNVDFKPVIALPELVEKKTGEENETEVFVERCRLFRFDPESKQWKERGTGEMKILKNKEKVKFRIIMRRDQILKLCANHYLTSEMHLTRMATSDRAWCYSAMDFSEEEMKAEQLAVKFKNAEKASAFQVVFEDCCKQLKEEKEKSTAPGAVTKETKTAAADSTSDKTDGAGASFNKSSASQQSKETKSLSDMFKPKTGSWECSGCYIRNNEDVAKCPACGTVKPGSKPASTATSSSLSEMFKPKAGSWECDGCLVRNNSDVVKCPACGTLKAGTKPEDVPKPAAGGISFGASLSAGPAGTGFKFGTPASSTSSMPTTGGFTFTAPTTTPPATGGFKFGAPVTSTPPTTGFGFKNDSTAEQKPAGFPVKTTPNPTGFIFGGLTAPSGATATTPSATTAATTSTGLFSTTPSTPSGSSTALSTPSAGFTFGPKPTGFSFASPASTAKAPSSSGLLAKLLTSDDVKPEVTSAPGSAPTGFSFTMPSKSNTSFGSVTPSTSSTTQGFQFSFSKSPVKSQQMPVVPGSPEVDEHGMYINKEGDDSHIHFEPVVALPEKIEVKTGEEDEAILFESRGKMYRFVSGEWKEKGVGVVKILEHKDTKKTRVLMRRDQVLKICCNHKIEPALSLQPMAKSDGKAWVWYALDFSEDGDDGKMEQLALRFRNAEIANEFKKVFEQCRDNSNTNQSRTQEPDVSIRGDESLQDEDDDDVIIIREEKPTAEQIAMARKFLLPDTFYLYENRPPCPGCIGCEDGELPKSVAPVSAAKTSVNKKFKDNLTSTKPPAQQTIFGGAGNLPDFASLTSDTPSDKKDGNSFVFGSGASLDFSSLASSNKAEEFSWKKTDASAPFKFAGAGQKLFGVGTTGKEAADDGDDGGTVAPSEDIHFEPVIPLPDLVEVKTGEEDWKVLFCQRAKLYKFDEGLNQWKERGIGDLKIMQHNTKNMFRILQRREQVLKVACNHLISVDMNLKPLSTSETAWCWVANDFTDTEPSVERFAAKFKTKDIAMEFSKIFTSCQEKLSTQENASSSEAALETGRAQDERVQLLRSLTLEVAEQDAIVPATYKGSNARLLLWQSLSSLSTEEGGAGKQMEHRDVVDAMSAGFSQVQGDKGNRFHAKALDVTGQDFVASSSYIQLGEREASEVMKNDLVTPLGDKGNRHHTKALDVVGEDFVAPASYTPLGGSEHAKDKMVSSSTTPLGDKGNRHHTKALDVVGQDFVAPASYTPLGGSEKTGKDKMVSTTTTPLGDKGNRHHTKALDVVGQDFVAPASYTPLGGSEKTGKDKMVSSSITPLGDKGNRHHTKALDVVGQDFVAPASYTPLGGSEHAKDKMVSSSITPLGDKGNRHHSKALDVVGEDFVAPATYTPLGGSEKTGKDKMVSSSITPLGDKGNRHHSKTLDVVGQDFVAPATYTPLGGSEKTGKDKMVSTTITPLGDKGNRHHTKALDVVGQDFVAPATYTPLGGSEKTGKDKMVSTTITPLGDKGNRHHSKALDVVGQDFVAPASYTPLGGSEYAKDKMVSSSITPLGDKGNRHHSKALDVVGQDFVASATYTPLGGSEKTGKDKMVSSSTTPLGDKGNRHHSKALDVVGQDFVAPASYTPLGGSEKNKPDKMVSSSTTPLGDKGNRHHSKALDVVGQDFVAPASYTPLGGSEKTGKDKMVSSSTTPLGDKGNRHHSKALDVVGQDFVAPASYTPLGGSEKNKPDKMVSSSTTPLGDKGNRHHTKALDVVGQDFVASSSYTPLGAQSGSSQPTSFGQLLPSVYYNQGDGGNPFYTQMLNLAGLVETMTATETTPLGDKGNIYHTKLLDKADVGTEATLTASVQSSAYEDEEEDDEEEEDSENILFEKRVTLSSYENGTLTRIGLGNVQVMYNEDLNGNSIVFKTDDGATRCSHVICLEHTISFDPKRNVCEWKPIDYSTDEPIRKHFSAAFSSPQAAEEFVKLFNAGQKLAVDSEISEKVPTDIDDPEIYSAGGN